MEEVVEKKEFNWKVPQCCLELWDNCPHVVKREKPKKGNIGL